MTENFDVRKVYSAVGRMDVCDYSLEITTVPLKEHITETNFFWKKKHTIAARFAQIMIDGNISRQNKSIIL